MAPDVYLSPAGKEELAVICEIEKKCFGAEGFSRRQLLYLVTRSKGMVYVARRNGAVIAYLSLLFPEQARHVRIYSLAVDPEERGNGVGAGLIDLAEACARERGLAAVSLEVKTTNRSAVGLYEKKGFVRRGIRRAYYPDGSDAYRMVRML